MRIRSLHPKYLDKAGLVACRRETLLAKHVLLGKTKGYKNHPQLFRFKEYKDPVKAIDTYLYHLYLEATTRGYHFDQKKFSKPNIDITLTVNKGQIEYELQHLLKKLCIRDKEKYHTIQKEKKLITHPLFIVKKGGIHDREKTGL